MTSEHKPSILIVDDDETYRNRLARAFVDRGYDVRTAHDYDSALAAATTDSPEFAVVDLKMPGKSGLELVKSLHEVDPATKSVVLTGYGSIATAIDAVRLGVLPVQAGRRRRHRRRVRARRGPTARPAGAGLRRVQGAVAGARRVGAHQPRAVGRRRQHLGGGPPARHPPPQPAAQAPEVPAARVTTAPRGAALSSGRRRPGRPPRRPLRPAAAAASRAAAATARRRAARRAAAAAATAARCPR